MVNKNSQSFAFKKELSTYDSTIDKLIAPCVFKCCNCNCPKFQEATDHDHDQGTKSSKQKVKKVWFWRIGYTIRL